MEAGGSRLITLSDVQPVDTATSRPSLTACFRDVAAPRVTHLATREPSSSASFGQRSAHPVWERERLPLKANAFERATKVHCLNLRSLFTALPEPIAVRRGRGLEGRQRPGPPRTVRPSSALGATSRSSRGWGPQARPASAASRRSLNATGQINSSTNNKKSSPPRSDDVRPPVVKISPYLTRADRGVVKEQLLRERLGALFDALASPDGYIRGDDYRRAKIALKLEDEGNGGIEEGAEGGGWIDWDGFLVGIEQTVGGSIGKLSGGVVAAAIKELGSTGRDQVAGPRRKPAALKPPAPAAPHGTSRGAEGARRRPASARPASRAVGGGKTAEWRGDLDMDLSGGAVPMVARIPFVRANRVPSQGNGIAPHRRPSSAPPAGRKNLARDSGQRQSERESVEAGTPGRLARQELASPGGSPGKNGASHSRPLSPIKSPVSPSKASTQSRSRSPNKQERGPNQPQFFSSEGIPMWPGRWPEKERQQQERNALLASGEHDREAYLSLFLGGRRDMLAQGDDSDDQESKAERVREARQSMDERWAAQLSAIFDNDFWKDPTKNRVRVRQRVENNHPLPDARRHLLDKSMEELMERTLLDERGELELDAEAVTKLGAEKLCMIEDGARKRQEEQLKDEEGLRASVEAAVVDLGEDRAGWLARELGDMGILFPNGENQHSGGSLEQYDTQGARK